MNNVTAYGATQPKGEIKQLVIERRNVTNKDIEIEILYCGICHSDIHQVNDDWGGSHYPIVPGHEIIGKILSIGSEVTKFKVGDTVGVGCLVGSCHKCPSCKDDLEQYCENGFTATYNSEDKIHGGITYGGYSDKIIVDEHFALSIPKNLDLKAVAPLLCAGITTYSPLKNWNVKKDDIVGIIGLGGLGHMGVKIAHAMGAKVVMITTSKDKGVDAKKLGADEVLLSTNPEEMLSKKNTFDFILNTIPVAHDLNPYLELLKRDATMVLVGAVEPFHDGQVNGFNLIFQRINLAGSLIGGLKETQEMLNFCGEHNILPEVEMITPQQINTAYQRMLKNDVKYRFVIDMNNMS